MTPLGWGGMLRRGDVVTVRLGAIEGREQAGVRPAIVVSHDAFNAKVALVTVVPVTTFRGRRIYPNEALLPHRGTGLESPSIAMAQQVRTISTSRIGERIGHLPAPILRLVDDALRLHLSL